MSNQVTGNLPSSSHKALIDNDFCLNGCVIVDNIKVPFPDCSTHGNPFVCDRVGSNLIRSEPTSKVVKELKCGTMERCS